VLLLLLLLLIMRQSTGEPHVALIAGIVKPDRLPDLNVRAGGLDKVGVRAEASKGVGEVLAAKRVAVVVAHGVKLRVGGCLFLLTFFLVLVDVLSVA
jgi:hypothetical protein